MPISLIGKIKSPKLSIANGQFILFKRGVYDSVGGHRNIRKDINLLKELSKISREVIREYYRSTCRKEDSKPAAVAVIQTFGNYLSFNPHMHVLAADGCFGQDGFLYAPSINIDTASLKKLFIHKIFKMLLAKDLIIERVVGLISSWAHTSFGVYYGKRINPGQAR